MVPDSPLDLLDHVFQRFVKGDKSEGHGLGLAFVRAVAFAHGGRRLGPTISILPADQKSSSNFQFWGLISTPIHPNRPSIRAPPRPSTTVAKKR